MCGNLETLSESKRDLFTFLIGQRAIPGQNGKNLASPEFSIDVALLTDDPIRIKATIGQRTASLGDELLVDPHPSIVRARDGSQTQRAGL